MTSAAYFSGLTIELIDLKTLFPAENIYIKPHDSTARKNRKKEQTS